MSKKFIETNFSIYEPGNFSIKFPNGYRLSIGIGDFHYCDARNIQGRNEGQIARANTCEIAIISPKGKLTDICEHDQVIGHVTPAQLVKVIELMSDPNFTPSTSVYDTIRI